MTDSFWDRNFDYEAFKKTKKNIDAQIEEFIAEIEKQGPMQVDDLVNRNEVLVSIRDALGILDKKMQALMRHGIEALSDEDKMVVVSALEGVKNLLTLMKKISRDDLPQDGTLSNVAYGKRDVNGVPDWSL